MAKAPTDDEKTLQQNLEVQLGRLQTEYELLARDQELSKYSKANKLKSQTRQIVICERERTEILTNLNVAKSKVKEDEKLADNLENIVCMHEIYSHEVATSKETLMQIKEQIKMVKKRVQYLSTMQITDRQIQARAWKASIIVGQLENKLEVHTKKFCTIVGKNIQMRAEIDYLLGDRRSFVTVWNKFIERLVKGKKIMVDIIEAAQIAYDQRDEWETKLQALRAKAQTDLQFRIQEIRGLQMKLDEKQKFQDFLRDKLQKRSLKDLEQQERVKRKEQYDELKKKIQTYEELIDEVTTFMGETRLGTIVHKFRHQEQSNFMKFEFIINLIREMENVNDYLTDLYSEIDQLRELHEARKIQQATRLEDLNSELVEMIETTHRSRKEEHDISETYDKMVAGITTLFQICDCKNDPLLRLLGDQTKINQFNVHLYMQILENAILELMLKHNFKAAPLALKKPGESATEIEKQSIYGINDIITSSPCALCVEHEMVFEAIDKAETVLSQTAVRLLLQKQLKLPETAARVHNISKCHLPKAREIIQRRYMN